MQHFLFDRRGVVAVIFGLMLVPLLGLAGVAIDFVIASSVRSYLQAESDAAAIGAARGGAGPDDQGWVSYAMSATRQKYAGSDWVKGLSFSGVWASSTDFAVDGHARVPTSFLRAVPGMPDEIDVGVRSVARLQEPVYAHVPPTLASLDPEAADYNRIYVYCFDPGKAQGVDKGRTQMTPIADNAGSPYAFSMPACGKGEYLSYRLHNVRNARTTPSQWDRNGAEHYEYHTDTTVTAGVETYGLGGLEILETVVCDTLSQCKGKSRGGIIPEGRNRTPQQSKKACEPGKYIYYGWEDRPPGMGWTDRDYDDIRIVIGCPSTTVEGEETVRLVE